MKSIKLVGLAIGASLAFSANADAREFADIYTECGIGAMIAPNNEAVAAVTNVTWDLGTTAISSNISSEDACAGGKGASAAFIYDTYPQLENDLAVGEGEHLATLLTLAGISADAQDGVATALRSAFAAEVAAEDYASQSRYAKAEALYNLLHAHTS